MKRTLLLVLLVLALLLLACGGWAAHGLRRAFAPASWRRARPVPA